MLSELSTFLRGSCRFEARGDFPERFLNLCARSDMGLWNIERGDRTICANVIAGRYRRLLPLARKCRVRLHTISRHGLPFRLTPYRRRPGMPLGAVLFCCTIWFLSLFIWSVELPELTDATEEKLQNAMDDMGLSVGSLRSGIDASRMAIELQLRVPELTWAGINTYGSYLSVSAKEYEPITSAPPEGQPCNLVASNEGVILDIEPLRGTIEVKPGDAVVKGDLLVSGVVEHLDGSVQITDASAVVWASTTKTISCTMPFKQVVSERTGRLVTSYRVRLFGLELPLLFSIGTDGSFDREYSDWQLSVGTMKLPFEVRTERCYELAQHAVTYSPEEAEALAIKELERQIEAMDDVEILGKKLSVEQSNTGITVQMLLTVKENIAAPSPIGIQ